MNTRFANQTTVIDSKSVQPIAKIHTTENHDTVVRILDSADDRESEVIAEKIQDISPEGTPAYPELHSTGMLMLILGSLGIVIFLALAVCLIWGYAAGALVLVFGGALACLGNPVIWSTLLRAMERNQVENQHATE